MAIVRPVVLEKLPAVFMHKYDMNRQISSGGGLINPAEMMRHYLSPTEYKFIPLTSSGKIIEQDAKFVARGDFLREMRKWKYVAVRCEKKGAFISCRSRKTYIPGLGDSALVEYRKTVGASERFEIQHYPETGAFSFRSHNGLYISNNKTLGAIIFRSESRKAGATIASRRTWEITPIIKCSSAEPHVKFVGVVNNSKKVIIQLQSEEEEGEDLKDNDYYLDYANVFVWDDIRTNGLKRGECAHFKMQNGDWHYYLRDKNGVVFVVVVSEDYSRALAGECVNDLCVIYKKYYGNGKNDKRLTNQGLRRNETIQKELQFLMWNCNEHNESCLHNVLRRNIRDQMEDAIDSVIENKGNAKDLQERVKELNKITNTFRNNARKLRARQVSKWVLAGVVGGGLVGGAGGGLIGMIVWGPAGAVIFASQAAKFGAFALGSGASIGVAANCNTPLMWKKWVPPPPRKEVF